jgi:hypothetical protein
MVKPQAIFLQAAFLFISEIKILGFSPTLQEE